MALRNDLHTWLSAQPLWQQDLAKRLIAHPQLDGDEYDETLRMVKAAFGALGEGESAPAPQTVALDDLPADAATGAPRLVGFGRLRGVGAVSSEHELRLAPTGLTVIYGQNAVGKTTFVRAPEAGLPDGGPRHGGPRQRVRAWDHWCPNRHG